MIGIWEPDRAHNWAGGYVMIQGKAKFIGGVRGDPAGGE